MATQLFPAFLKLQDRPVLLVGGGTVAASKLRALLDAGAIVTVVAPEIRDELKIPGVFLIKREFILSDLDNAWFVVAAAPGPVNRVVATAAEERRVFVNAVDDIASASAYLGGVVRKGGVTIAISTDGRAPALAGLLREALHHLLPDDLAGWIDLSEQLRIGWRRAKIPISERRPLLLRALDELYADKRNEGGLE